ncbi:MAG: DNA-binding protein [Cellvibrionaceae bacterium]
MEYIFTLKYQLAEHDSDLDALVERLGAAGCDDALVGVGQLGRLALEFSREADSAEEAVRTALVDVKQAIPSARLIEASPDLVGLTDVADIVGISRQAMRKLMLAHRTTFPMPVHEGSASIWHLAEVLDWLKTRSGYQFDTGVLEAARAALEVNIAKEASRHPVRDHGDMELLTA